MGEPTAVLPVVFVDGDQSVDLGTVTVQPSLGVKISPNQISASLARPRRSRRVPLDDSGCYVQAALRRSRRGGRSRRDKKHSSKQQPETKTILKRPLPATDLASLAMFGGGWDYEAQLQRQREWYLINTQPDPYLDMSERPASASRCRECEAAAAAMRDPAFHWCVRDAVTVGFRSPVGPIERPPKRSPSPSPATFRGIMPPVY